MGDDMRKKLRTGENENEICGNKENISLGSLSLKQFEEMNKRSEQLLLIHNDYLTEKGVREKVEADLEKVLKKMQDMEEGKTR